MGSAMSSRNPLPSSWLCASTVGTLGPGQMLIHWEEEVHKVLWSGLFVETPQPTSWDPCQILRP